MNLDEKRTYNSEIREQQKQSTRKRILEGLISTMADGVVDVSIPAVAKASGISVPTIYRHFPNKQALIAALPGYLAEKMGAPVLNVPEDLASYLQMLKQFYSRADNLDDTMRAAAMSEAATNIRHSTRPERLQMIEHLLAPYATDLPVADQERLRNVVLVMATSAVLKAFTDYLGVSWAEAADSTTWAIEMMIKGAQVRDGNNE